MPKDQIDNEATWLRALLSDFLELESSVDWEQVDQDGCLIWDSLVHIAIVDEVETFIGRECTSEEILSMTSYSEVLKVLLSGVGSVR